MEVLSFTIWAGGALRDMEVMASRGLVAHPNIIMEEVVEQLLIFLSNRLVAHPNIIMEGVVEQLHIFLSNRGGGVNYDFCQADGGAPHPQPSCKPAGGKKGG